MSETFTIWLEYCNMYFLLLDFIVAKRNSDWSFHLETSAEMIVYDSACDYYKYISWGLVYCMCVFIYWPKVFIRRRDK